MTIVLTTHYLDEADSMAERVVVVDHGEVIADDSPESLKTNLAGDRITATATDGGRLSQLVAALRGARDVVTDGNRIEARVVDGPAALPELLRAAEHAGVRVVSAAVHRPTLDDVFLALTGRSLREANDSYDLSDSVNRKGAA
jgi:ABC-2 type transport system ATP-binding protein